jgi:hypothetical protein
MPWLWLLPDDSNAALTDCLSMGSHLLLLLLLLVWDNSMGIWLLLLLPPMPMMAGRAEKLLMLTVHLLPL